MGYHSKIDSMYCLCAYPELNESQIYLTKSKLPRYKCKRCDLWWKNSKYEWCVK
jgi:hypothetical protein